MQFFGRFNCHISACSENHTCSNPHVSAAMATAKKSQKKNCEKFNKLNFYYQFLQKKQIQNQIMLTFFTALVAEVTQPSLGVGYEIGRAIENNKKILCLFRPHSGKCKSVYKPFLADK